MSTRATVHFEEGSHTSAIIYRHCDGYPDGLGNDLEAFLTELGENVKDTRFGDPSYLAAKWVVWDAMQMHKYAAELYHDDHALNFLSVGIVSEDPPDIEWRYIVRCNGGRPRIECQEIA